MSDVLPVAGACLCGALRFEAEIPPRRVTHCHCAMCRRHTGGAVATFATFESARTRWIGELARYDSSERGWRGSCPVCGSSVCFGFKPRPERLYVAVGILDHPERYPAGFHDFRDEQIDWLSVDDHLPDAADFRP